MSKTKISDTLVVMEHLGSGSFGNVYLAKNKINNEYVAVKVEERNPKSRIANEYKIYSRLHASATAVGIPEIYQYIKTPRYNIMSMQLLGQSIDDLFSVNKCLKLPTVLKLAVDIMNIIEGIHKAKVIHRDIKPNNFMVDQDRKNIYIMDFGLSKKYVDADGKHIKFKNDRELVGTARYASLNMHMGFEPSRRDDLESIGHMFVYLLKGSLPWQGIKKKGKEQIIAIGEVKMSTSLAKLCTGIPKCFMDYLDYCRKLEFEQDPDYDYLRKLFTDCASKIRVHPHFEWL